MPRAKKKTVIEEATTAHEETVITDGEAAETVITDGEAAETVITGEAAETVITGEAAETAVDAMADAAMEDVDVTPYIDPETGTAHASPEAAERTKKTPMPLRNDIRMPARGATKRVWDLCDELGVTFQRQPSLTEVREAGIAEGLNPATISTQYNRYRKFYNLPALGRPKKVLPVTDVDEPAEAATPQPAEE